MIVSTVFSSEDTSITNDCYRGSFEIDHSIALSNGYGPGSYTVSVSIGRPSDDALPFSYPVTVQLEVEDDSGGSRTITDEVWINFISTILI